MHKGQRISAAFLFLCLLTPASQYCRLGTVAECNAARLAPGNSIIGLGFDITTMMFAPNIILDMNHKYPNGTCHLCQNTYEPDTGKQLQAIALNIDKWLITPSCESNTASSSHSSVIGMADMQEKEIGVEWSREAKIPVPKIQGSVGFVLAGSHSKLVTDMRRLSMASNNVYFRQDINCIHYRIDLKPNPTVVGLFQNKTNSLPADYNCYTKKEYLEVIKFFGTHFITGGDLGGRARSVMSVEQCSMTLSELSAQEIKHCLSWKYSITAGKIASASGDLSGCTKAQEQHAYKKQFKALETKEKMYVEGGEQGKGFEVLKGTRMFSDWTKSIPDKPVLISKSIISIHELLPQNSPQRDNLQKAVGDYITQRALKVNCLNACSGSDPRTDCHCTCDLSKINIDSICCPRNIYAANMHVYIDYGEGLWGDFLYTDTFVRVKYLNDEYTTDVINNDNYPLFDKRYVWNNINLIEKTNTITITVYDKDPWGDEKLGSCTYELYAASIQERWCSLNYGRVRYRVLVMCLDALSGSRCEKKKVQAPTFSSIYPQ